ncbi:extracellular solute-binding protein [Anaerocolumna xylanovorans]|uniref:Putative aldouronate transport system substrate-binding protein n=1 Tax=Anaerocolumna xylanovorans DSM 12503 TaxID=1121345 RepID=A0A1M7YKU1_9FIRM|nr:extracellular solute-binding protein [Anaerocolumna xylanovorans]SHO53202.1 putative aldouronate transport system substrate-binding protein [Anaerocolumna xylanovorans DSM 12503]
MKKTFLKRFLTLGLIAALVVSSAAACSKSDKNTSDNNGSSGTTDAPADKPDTWIADRTITIQAYVDDIGNSLPKDLNNTEVMKEITKRTGIKLNIQYTPGDSDSSVMAAQLASGTVPDVIVSYLNDSTRPEFPILLKAAREGMFADVSGYLKDTKVYSRYLEDDYLPNDTKKNITFRDEFDGAAYILQFSIDSEDRSLQYNPEDAYVGGLYIQKSIVDALGIDPYKVNTQEQFYDLLVKIKNGGFKDDNGNAVYPLGPKYWGGSSDTLEYITPGYNWGVSDGYNITDDGTIKHEIDTDYVYEKINYVRKLLAEGLMNPEFFTMDSTRAEEVSKSHNSAIMADVHNYQEIIYGSDDWTPLGPLNDFTGNNSKVVHGKSGYGAFAISADAKNPEEILKFFDYLSTPEGQMLSEYGVEGVSYNMVDGKPVLTDEALAKLNEGDKDYLVNKIGAGFGGAGFAFFDYVLTNLDRLNNFGESRPGAGSSTTFARSVEIAKDYPRTLKLVPGLDATAYLSADSLADVKAQMSLLNYKDMLVQAIYANSDEEVKKIVESFREQLKQAGNDTFIEYIGKLYKDDKESIDFYTK